jgi:hypothetical protein
MELIGPLPYFLEVVRHYEEHATLERSYWRTHDQLGNYLGREFEVDYDVGLIAFLRDWDSYRTSIDWLELNDIWTPQMRAIALALQSVTLEGCNFSDTIQVPERRLTIAQATRELYSRLLRINGIGPTNASKLLSISLPNFFVMWDDYNIRRIQNLPINNFKVIMEGLGWDWDIAIRLHRLGTNLQGYLQFLKARQGLATQLIRQVQDIYEVTWSEAVVILEELALNSEWNSIVSRRKPIAKLIDEYFYGLRHWASGLSKSA